MSKGEKFSQIVQPDRFRWCVRSVIPPVNNFRYTFATNDTIVADAQLDSQVNATPASSPASNFQATPSSNANYVCLTIQANF